MWQCRYDPCIHMHKENSNNWIIYFRCMECGQYIATAVILVKDYPLAMGFKPVTTHGFITECITGFAEIILSRFQVSNCLEEIQ